VPRDDPPRSAWVLAAVQDGARVVELRSERRQHQVVDRGGDGRGLWFVHHPQGQILYEMRLPADLPFAAFVPDLLDGLRHGSDDVVAAARELLSGVSGVAAKEDGEEALKTYEEWYGNNRDGRFRQQ